MTTENISRHCPVYPVGGPGWEPLLKGLCQGLSILLEVTGRAVRCFLTVYLRSKRDGLQSEDQTHVVVEEIKFTVLLVLASATLLSLDYCQPLPPQSPLLAAASLFNPWMLVFLFSCSLPAWSHMFPLNSFSLSSTLAYPVVYLVSPLGYLKSSSSEPHARSAESETASGAWQSVLTSPLCNLDACLIPDFYHVSGWCHHLPS